MANAIEDAENLVVLVLILGVLGLAVWWFANRNSSSGGIVDDVSSWLKNLFSPSSGGDGTVTWLAPEDSGQSSEPLPPPTQDQIANVQNGLQDFQQFSQNPEPWQNQALDWALQNRFF